MCVQHGKDRPDLLFEIREAVLCALSNRVKFLSFIHGSILIVHSLCKGSLCNGDVAEVPPVDRASPHSTKHFSPCSTSGVSSIRPTTNMSKLPDRGALKPANRRNSSPSRHLRGNPINHSSSIPSHNRPANVYSSGKVSKRRAMH